MRVRNKIFDGKLDLKNSLHFENYYKRYEYLLLIFIKLKYKYILYISIFFFSKTVEILYI